MISCRILLVGITLLESLALGGDLNRQSIVFYEKLQVSFTALRRRPSPWVE
ncbi:Hypothetical protein FKW44_008373 [Caligus rogercresseyi]|uniref:Uncharacterized protein n=1 Tax=Caligus rogercresseyi TaxID=217165 RepID=A0A7T8KFZ5_CALRO|nr:Hypothetical protein FKW44_008373 [Caligus rogercresseyi]